MHFYQFNIGDYKSHTEHLSEMEDLTYRRLLDWYYLHESPIPLDELEVARQIRMRSHSDCIAVVLREYFERTDDGWIHHRANKELAKAGEKSTKASQSAKARWDKKSNKNKDLPNDANALRTQSEGNANHKPITNNQEPLTILKPEEPKGSLSGSLPTCAHKEVIDLFHKTLPELPEVRIWNKTRESLLKARWRETATRLDWKSTQDGLEYFEKLFNWIRQSKFLMGKVNPKPGQRAFECELEWILRPQNWAKLIEGKYHAV